MKIVVNGCFGAYGMDVANEFKELAYSYIDDRANPKLVEFVLSHPDKCGNLCVATIPDTATDWEISDYDGSEWVVYVKGGKIYHAYKDR